MQKLARTIGLGFLAICLLAVPLKLFVPVPGALGYAPVDLGLAPPVAPVEVVIWYGTEKQSWLEEAARRFEAGAPTVGGRPIVVRLVGLGSREIAERVGRQEWGGDPRPTVVSPASSLWTAALAEQWAAANGGGILAADVRPLALTPLVAVAWEERAGLLWAEGTAGFWEDLHAGIVGAGWAAVATERGFGPESAEGRRAAQWGFVKFGHSSPLTSNSGVQTLLLLAYAFHNKSAGLTTADIADPAFQAWLEAIESSTLEFGDSTGSFMTDLVRFGPSKYDVVMVYENLAIERIEAAERQWGQPLRVYYPPATSFSDHPYAILDAPLTTAAEREAAARFRDFLLARSAQELALQYGFRPVSPDVSITAAGAGSPFERYAGYGVQADIAQQVEAPSAAVLAALLDLWSLRIQPLTLQK
jgi:hypothetical protein